MWGPARPSHGRDPNPGMPETVSHPGHVGRAFYHQPVAITADSMRRTVGYHLSELLMRAGARLSVAALPDDWPGAEHDSCPRCRDQVTLPVPELVEMLLRAASGEPVARLRMEAYGRLVADADL
jgi:hypothetical protein